MITSDFRKKMVNNWFSYLQIQICKSFESLENKKSKFLRRNWRKENIRQGGGTSYLLTGGNIFDKVGVNKSTVSGIFQIFLVLKTKVIIGPREFQLLLI